MQPHNEEAERALLGALLLDPQRVAEIAEVVHLGDFFHPKHEAVWEAIVSLAERAEVIDLVSVGEALRQSGKFKLVGGRAFLVELAGAVASSAHAHHHARIVADTATMRRLMRECGDIIAKAQETRPDGNAVTELLSDAEERMFRIASRRESGGPISMSSAVADAFRRIDSASHRGGLTGLPSGFHDLDDMLCGFNAGDLIVVAARPSMGKTALVLNCIDHAADPDHAPDWLDHQASILFFSLEMGAQSIIRRMLCSRAKVEAGFLRSGRVPTAEYAELSRAAGELRMLRIHIDDTPGLSVFTMRSRAKAVKAKHGLDMIVVDYLQLMSHTKSENRQQEVSHISRMLKEMARELGVPVIALSQLSRAVEARDDKRPQLSDLRESGSIEQDADVVLLLYREEYYDKDKPEAKGMAEVICAKQRNGPVGTVNLRFNGPLMRFDNPSPTASAPFSST